VGDVAARLLAAIDECAAHAEAAKGLALVLPRRNGKATLHTFMNDNGPEAVLRRCEADRRIVQTYQRTCNSLHIDAFGVMAETVDNLLDAYGLPREHEVPRG
jgi:hypothetical protein